jgi:hypothetical protein
MRKTLLATLFALLGNLPAAHADGSVTFADADAFLKQAPEVRAYLMDTLCISAAGAAPRLSGEYPLGGERIGPYTFQARPKGKPDGPRFELSITTYQIFYGADGKALAWTYGDDPPYDRAYSIKEMFKSAEISKARSWAAGLAAVNCDEAL